MSKDDFVQAPLLCPSSKVTVFRRDEATDPPPPVPPKPGELGHSASTTQSVARAASAGNGLCNLYSVGAYYCHATGDQTVPWQTGAYGMFTSLTENQPVLGRDSYHTLAQLWGIDSTPGWPGSTQEMGWTSDWDWNGGAPTLFAYHFDDNNGMGYAGCGAGGMGPGGFFCQAGVPTQVGQPVANWNAFNTFGIERYGTNWWFYYDGYWIGYIPSSQWPLYFNSGWLEMEAGGEVAASTATPCSQMGDGINAYPPPGGNNAAAVGGSNYYYGSGSVASNAFSPYVDSRYPTGFYSGNPASAFHYGGAGFHAC